MDVGATVWVQYQGLWYEAVVEKKMQDGQIECCVDMVDDNGTGEGWKENATITPDKVLARNTSEVYHSVADLTKLVHLHEPAILQVLKDRFQHGHIYTSTGSILVAVNPFRSLDCYSSDIKSQYFSLGGDVESAKQLPPHIYSVGDKAFRKMQERSSQGDCNQTILVSGESGAGKTETTKLIMNYLAFVSTQQVRRHSHGNSQGNSSIHDRVLESNPILESFGNARTTRNNNSSRFGKFIKLGFNASGEMLGASISTYLLERVRLVSQARGERSYHIFYELCQGASADERKHLDLQDVQAYAYLNKSDCYTRLDGVDDGESYAATRKAMTGLGMDEVEQVSVMQVVSSVLHLGNVNFVNQQGKEEAMVDTACASTVETVCRLLGVEKDVLQSTLSTKRIKAGMEYITTSLTTEQAASTRDSIVKTLYSNLFEWLVARINTSIQYQEDKKRTQFIGVVDIFGFEIFEQNRLEQLCINYANEKLQQLFGAFVFRMEQDEYVAEEIPWSFVDYPNNDACVAVLERKQKGIFSLLDEQCLMPRGNDEKLANKYQETLEDHDSFSMTKLQKARRMFVIHHYAGDVCYTTDGFCDKNKDHMHTEAVDLLRTSQVPFICKLFDPAPSAEDASIARKGSGRRRGGIMSSTVASQFKSQLSSLLDILNATEPHFVRCVKPNDVASASILDRKRVLEQLRCSGVLEAVKISRSGYPVRLTHDVFISNYLCLMSDGSMPPTSDYKDFSARMVETFMTKYKIKSDSDDRRPPFQVGKTKVFALLEAHQVLEAARAKALHHSIVTLQRYWLGYVRRAQFLRWKHAAVVVQATFRCHRCHKRYLRRIRIHRAVVRIQSVVRMHMAKKWFRRFLAATVIQSFIRGWLVRRGCSANTLSVSDDEDEGSFADSIMRFTGDSLVRRTSFDKRSTNVTADSERDVSIISSMDSEKPYTRSKSQRMRESKQKLANYTPPTHIEDEYEIVWECGLLGLYFESDPTSGMPVVRRVHESLSNCADIFEVTKGDILLSVGKMEVKKGEIRRTLAILQEVEKPVRLRFERSQTKSLRERQGSLELLGEEDYEVLWLEGVPLGLGFRPDPDSGYPCVLQANGNAKLPGMFNVRVGDHLIFINEFSTRDVRFQKVIDILESGPRPVVLRFRHADSTEDLEIPEDAPQDDFRYSSLVSSMVSSSAASSRSSRRTRLSMNPRDDASLYYITWKDEDGPLGIVVKQESMSYYPRVINVKNEGAVARSSQKNRVEIGDVLLSINNNNISKMGFGAAMKLLQRGPKPLLLMFQRPQEV